MRLLVRGFVDTAAIVWGLVVFVVGIANMIWPSYAVTFLQALDSIYPGYHATGSFASVIAATLYSIAAGAVCAAVFGCLYNRYLGAEQEDDDDGEKVH